MSEYGEETVTDDPEEMPQSSEETEESSISVFDQFEAALDEHDIPYEKLEMAAEYIGAVEGFKYKTEDGTVELYIFDKNSDTYKVAEDSQMVTMEGIGDFPARVEHGMAFVGDGLENDIISGILESVVVGE